MSHKAQSTEPTAVSEKPLESNLKKAKEIFKIIQKKKIFFASTYNYMGYPGIIEISLLQNRTVSKCAVKKTLIFSPIYV